MSYLINLCSVFFVHCWKCKLRDKAGGRVDRRMERPIKKKRKKERKTTVEPGRIAHGAELECEWACVLFEGGNDNSLVGVFCTDCNDLKLLA